VIMKRSRRGIQDLPILIRLRIRTPAGCGGYI
jgi:hypothetical protein